VKVKDVSATVKSLYVPLVFWTGRTISEPWYLAVSTPPNRMEPVSESWNWISGCRKKKEEEPHFDR